MFTNIIEAFEVSGPIPIAIYVVMVLSWWFIFEKAGKPAWWSLIPILNFVAFIDIAGKPCQRGHTAAVSSPSKDYTAPTALRVRLPAKSRRGQGKQGSSSAPGICGPRGCSPRM